MIALDQAFWVGVSFVIFVLLALRPVGSFILGGLDKRAVRIKAELEEALLLKEEAQALLVSYQRKQREAEEEAKDILEFAKTESKRITEKAEHDLEESLNKRVNLAMQKISLYEQAVLQQVKQSAVDIAISTVRSLVTEAMDKNLSNTLIEKAMEDVAKKIH